MKLTTKGRFAVTAMVDLALHEEEAPISLTQISERQQISVAYLEQIFCKLRRAGLVASVRGPGGGYRLGAPAGDITAAMPYRAMVNIINFIQAVDHVVPGFAAVETLLYSPELKFYSNRVKMDTDLNTSIHNLHCLGDASGWTRGLMMASCMGVLMGRKLAEQENA